MNDTTLENAIAIIGMSARFPGGHDCRSLWQVLEQGETTATRFDRDELDPSLPAQLVESSNYVPVRGVLPDAECFDAEYFEFTRREAEVLDPQQRLFLQLAVHALEDAGYYRDTREYPIGVYAGLSNITYYQNHLARRPEAIARVGELNAMMANEKDYLATRVAHKLDLTGPCLNISTACSTSSVAISQAFYALQTFQCDLALAGGISVTTPQSRGYLYQEGSILSPDGVCRPFDAAAQGTFFSNGGGIIVMKRLQEAIDDDDCIAAIIRGVGVNNDGARRASFAAPGVEGQAEAIMQALANAEVDPRDIGFVEAHGTATPIGDPIEIEALRLAFEEYTRDRGYCAIGSLKSNIGHLDVAAGVAGVIKAILSMQAGKIPPTANFQAPNPELRIEDSPFYVNDKLIEWPRGTRPRLAGISSFGSGGTNAHIILQEAPERSEPAPARQDLHAVMLSARTESALVRQFEQMKDFCATNPEVGIADIAYTHRVGRREDLVRAAVIAESTPDLHRSLEKLIARPVCGNRGNSKRGVAFLFPGQGAQYPGMGQQLYAKYAVFREAMDLCFELFDPQLEASLQQVMFEDTAAGNGRINQTEFTQPALFSIGYALSKLYADAGIRPDAMIGHSIGEYLAAHLAGVFSLEDAIAVVATRGRLMQSMAPGAMLAVLANPEEVERRLPPDIWIAGFNSPRATVVAGGFDVIDAFQGELEAADIGVKRLSTSHAFHTPMMQEAASQLTSFLGGVDRHAVETPFVSTVTGTWISDDEARSPNYWGGQICKPVRFSQAAAFLVEQGPRNFLEMGPGAATIGFLRQHISDKTTHGAVAGMDSGRGEMPENLAYMQGLAKLWEQGTEPAWDQISKGCGGRRIPLPGYAFDRQRFWIEATSGEFEPEVSRASDEVEAARAGDSDIRPAAGESGLSASLRELVADMVGIASNAIDQSSDLIDLGFDSLLLTQLSIALKREYSVEIPFRHLLDDLATLDALYSHIDEHLPDNLRSRFGGEAHDDGKAALASAVPVDSAAQPAGEVPTPGKSRGASITRSRGDTLDARQEQAVRDIVAAYVDKTSGSKAQTQAARPVLSDPRSVAGFNPTWKEAVYPIVTNRSEGAYVWDVDGNRFVDFTCGFGPIMLGHGPEFLREAVIEQVKSGVETGPQSPLAFEVSAMIATATGVERVAFASTGTEAVIAATRIARTVTGRNRILIFAGAYHGIHDEVTINPRHLEAAAPGAPGIPRENLANVLVAPYDSDEALRMIEENADSLAAVLVEPVQSRNPELQPREFLHRLRALTERCQIALIFDEIVTGFRVALGGAQAMFDVQADIVTYGKVVGGGYPIGIVAGKSRFLDALDGGAWSYGDESVPEAGVTFFAGTFVRHPLMLAAARATLKYLLEQGPELQETLNRRTETLCASLAGINRANRVRIALARCCSWFVIEFADPVASAMFYLLMRSEGIFIWEGRVVFLNTALSDEDLHQFVAAYETSVKRLVENGLLAQDADNVVPIRQPRELDSNRPPVPGARLGRDPQGRPGWYVEDPDSPGKYRLFDAPGASE